jgi:hypothetical protein
VLHAFPSAIFLRMQVVKHRYLFWPSLLLNQTRDACFSILRRVASDLIEQGDHSAAHSLAMSSYPQAGIQRPDPMNGKFPDSNRTEFKQVYVPSGTVSSLGRAW